MGGFYANVLVTFTNLALAVAFLMRRCPSCSCKFEQLIVDVTVAMILAWQRDLHVLHQSGVPI